MKKLLLLITGLLLLFNLEGQILRYSNYTASTPPTVLVESISVWGTGGATTISTNGGTLQMLKKTLPTNAADTSVTWSGTNAVGTVSETGLVTALTNGTVTPRATANDGSGVYGEEEITISNQATNHIYNGDFSLGNVGWSHYGTSINSGQITWTDATPYGSCRQLDILDDGNFVTLEASTTYTFSFEVISFTGGGGYGAHLMLESFSGTHDYIARAGYLTGVYNIDFTTPSSFSDRGIRISFDNEDSNTQIVLDNLSIVVK